MVITTQLDLREMSFANLRDYLADAVTDPHKARVVIEEAEHGPLFERFECRLLSELYADVFAHHAQVR